MNIHQPNKKYFDDLVKKGYIRFSLLDSAGGCLVPFNTNKVTPQDQIIKIQQKLNLISPGQYQLLKNTSLSNKVLSNLDIITCGPLQNLNDNAPEIVRKTKEEKTTENLLSLDTAVKNITESANLKAENEVLKQRVKELEIKNAELLAELDEEPENLEEQNAPAPFANWIQTILPTLSPLADEYFKLQNRKIQLEEAKVMTKYKPPFKRNTPTPKQPEKMNLPNIQSPEELENFYNYLDSLNDDKFNEVLNTLEHNAPELADLVKNEFFEQDEENNESEQTNE